MTRLFPAPPDGRGTLNPGALDETLQTIEAANPDYRLVGSLGRAVLYNQYFDDPYREYDIRRELPLRTKAGTARDVDLLNAPSTPTITPQYPIDIVWADNPDASITKTETGDWRLQSARYNFDELLEPEIMEPVRGKTVYQIDTMTVRPQTQLALFAVRGTLRRKDDIPVALMSDLVTHQEKTPLPQSSYDPFWDLAALQEKGALGHLKRFYRRHASDAVMHMTGPFLQRVSERKY